MELRDCAISENVLTASPGTVHAFDVNTREVGTPAVFSPAVLVVLVSHLTICSHSLVGSHAKGFSAGSKVCGCILHPGCCLRLTYGDYTAGVSMQEPWKLLFYHLQSSQPSEPGYSHGVSVLHPVHAFMYLRHILPRCLHVDTAFLSTASNER